MLQSNCVQPQGNPIQHQNNGTKEGKEAASKKETGTKKPGCTYAKDIETIINGCVVTGGLKVKFSDIIGMDSIKTKLRETVVMPYLKPELFKGLRAPTKGILMYGPPGNGKTMIAKAVATEVGQFTFFNVSAGTITTKYFGDSEKIIQALFGIAADKQPSIIFIDEIDSILGKRSDGEHDAMRRLKTEFLVQLDGAVSNPSDKIVVIGATNRPFDLDEAVLRRFTSRIYIGMPEPKARRFIIEGLMKDIKVGISDKEYEEIVLKSEGYSCADLKCISQEAAMYPIRDIPPDQLQNTTDSQIREVQLKDFIDAFKKSPPTVSKPTLEQFEKWHKANQGSA
jgi:spastin